MPSPQLPKKEILIPQDKLFFDLLEKQAKIVVEGAKALVEMTDKFDNIKERRRALKDIEHRGDTIVHELYDRINVAFMTPIDQQDLSALSKLLDDILDFIYAAGNRIYLFEVKSSTETMKHFSDVILKSAVEVEAAVMLVRKINKENMEKHYIEIQRLENVADDLLNAAVAELFKTTDPISIMKLKEIYEMLETVTDKCEDVSDVLLDISTKYG